VGKKTRVVIDTNVIVSAFGWLGRPEEVVRLVTKGKITSYISTQCCPVRYLHVKKTE